MKYLFTFICTLFVISTSWAQDDIKTTFFYKALKTENYEKIDRYLATGIDINVPRIDEDHHKGDGFVGVKSRTPLLYAIELNKPDLCQHLIEKGADVNQGLEVSWYQEDHDGAYDIYFRKPFNKQSKVYKPIIWAIESQNIDIINALLDAGADYSDIESSIKRCKNDKVWDLFTNLGVKLKFNAEDFEYHYHNYGPSKRLLAEGNIIPNAKTLNKMASWGDTVSIRKAMALGANINGMYKKKALAMCPLCEAVFECDLPLTKLLVEKYGAQVDPRCSFYSGLDFFEGTPLQLAQFQWGGKCKGRNDDMIEYLIFAESE